MAQMLVDLAQGTVNGPLQYPTVAGITSTGNGSLALDMHNAEVLTNVDLVVGDVTGTLPTLAVQIQESDDQTTWTSPVGNNLGQYTGLFTTVTAANKHQGIHFLRSKRYIRASYTVGGSAAPTFTVSIVAFGQRRFSGSGPGSAGGYDRSPSS